MTNLIKTPNYRGTFVATFLGIFNQAVITNITAIIFIPLMNLYGFTVWQFGILIGINFASQMVADVTLTFLIDRCKFRSLVLPSVALSFFGLLLFALSPILFPGESMFLGLIIATVIASMSSGMLEVLLSPIVDNLPSTLGTKNGLMSFMHSFYAWGQAACILITSIVILVFGDKYWNVPLLIWAVIPLTTFILFCFVPLDKREVEKKKGEVKTTLRSPILIVSMLAIMLGGATEVVVNQWATTFAVLSLGLDQTTANIAGMMMFAIFLGLGRLFGGKVADKVGMSKLLAICSFVTAGLLVVMSTVTVPVIALIACIVSGLFISLMWPGVLTTAGSFFPKSGAWVFAVLAIMGDLGGTIMPTAIGFVADNAGFSLAFLILAILPLLNGFCHMFLAKKSKGLSGTIDA